MRFFEPSSDIVEWIEEKFSETGLYNFIQLKVLGISKQSQVFNVSKASGLVKYIGNLDDAVVITVYEEAYDRLDEQSRELLLEDAIAQISYDTEKDKLVVTKPQINITVGGRRKNGEALINAAETSIVVIESIEQEEKEKKAAEREAKKAAKKNRG